MITDGYVNADTAAGNIVEKVALLYYNIHVAGIDRVEGPANKPGCNNGQLLNFLTSRRK